MKVLFVDGYNLFHRARYGFAKGEYSTVYTFFRSFRSLVERMGADKVIVALEGYPEFRHQLYPAYKANRKADPADTEKALAYADFKRQKNIIIDILAKLPIELLKHSKYEGDDLIGKLATSVYLNDECVVITGDTDFIQLFDQRKNIKIYNPIKKEYVPNPSYDYVLWKSMVGDTSDNIQGIYRVGSKTADKVLLGTPNEVSEWLDAKPERRTTVIRNTKLIRFADVPLDGIENLSQETDLESVKESFEQMEFVSMLTEKAWLKFEETFSE
jgi:DNA polymerase-1